MCKEKIHCKKKIVSYSIRRGSCLSNHISQSQSNIVNTILKTLLAQVCKLPINVNHFLER